MKKMKEKKPSMMARLKERMPKLMVVLKPTKDKVGKVAFVMIPLAIAAVGAGVGIYMSEKDRTPTTVTETVVAKTNKRIYLVSSDDLTIPLTVGLPKRDTTQEMMVEVFGLLKENSKANTGSIKGLIPKDTKLNSLEVFEGELILDVSEEFLNYQTAAEGKLLESIVYTYSEFPEVETISLYVDGKQLKTLPKNNTKVSLCLTPKMGINREGLAASDVSGKQMVNVYYQKKIDDKNYMVPVSQYVDKNDSLELQLVNAINAPLQTEKGLKKLSEYSYISEIQEDNGDDFVLNLKDDALLEEGVVKRSLYDLVSLTLDSFVDGVEISLKVADEDVMVEGLLDPEVYQVSDYIYNQIEI